MNRVTEPDADRGDVNGALVVHQQDEGLPCNGPSHRQARAHTLLVPLGVEPRRSPTLTTPGTFAGTAQPAALDAHTLQHTPKVRIVAMLARADDPGNRPAATPVMNGLPVPMAGRQVTPGDVGPDPEEHPVDHRSMIGPPAALPRVGRQQGLQPFPLGISQIMTIQAIFHWTDLHQNATEDPPDSPSVGRRRFRPCGPIPLGRGGASGCAGRGRRPRPEGRASRGRAARPAGRGRGTGSVAIPE